MDWTNRGPRANQPANQTPPVNKTDSFSTSPLAPKKTDKGTSKFGDLRIATAFLLVSVAILLLALIGYLIIFDDSGEKKYVNKDRLQAVFLNGGQVYFGRINSLNGNYLHLSDIYYLRVNQQVQPGQEANQSQDDISLVKLGCELHGPEDSMLINRDQVMFWENLKTDGQVTRAVIEYMDQNPDGQNCETTPQSNNDNTEQGADTGQQDQAQTPIETPAPTPTPTPTPTPNNENITPTNP